MGIDRIIRVPLMGVPALTPANKPTRKGNGNTLERHKGCSYDDGGLLYGNGCKHWHDCFTCPLPPEECHYNITKERYVKEKQD